MQRAFGFGMRVGKLGVAALGCGILLSLGCSGESGAQVSEQASAGVGASVAAGPAAGATQGSGVSAGSTGSGRANAGSTGTARAAAAAAAAMTGGAGSGPAAIGAAGAAGSGASVAASSGAPDAAGSGASGAPGGGAPGAAGSSASSAASSGAGGSSAGSGPAAGSGATNPGQCGNAQPNLTPFGCKFAWGTNDPGGALSAFAGLSFVSKWVGYELDKAGNLPRCDGCSWLSQQVQSTSLVPVYYAYFIGFFGKANGLPDGNENPTGPNLTTDAAKLIRTQRAGLLNAYGSYAKQTAAVWRDKPLVWLLEGDFVQYTADTQKEKLSYTELGELARDITCAIKSQMPNAVVAINHSTWNSDQVTNDFWAAMKSSSYDLVWTTGVANNQGFMEQGADATKYNAKTATYAYLSMLTGKKLFVDTSFGLSEMADSWSSADAATLNARIAEGVIAANVTKPPADYVSKVGALQLSAICK